MKRYLLMDRLLDDMIADSSDDPLIMVDASIRELIPRFLERREVEIVELQRLLHHSCFPEMKMIGHRLKGTGTSYGFPTLTQIGKELEQAAISKNPLLLDATVSKLKTVIFDLKVAVTIRARN